MSLPEAQSEADRLHTELEGLGEEPVNPTSLDEDALQELGPEGNEEDDDAMREACTHVLVMIAQVPGAVVGATDEDSDVEDGGPGMGQPDDGGVLSLLLSLLDARSDTTRDIAASVMFGLAASDGPVSRAIQRRDGISRRLVHIGEQQGARYCR